MSATPGDEAEILAKIDAIVNTFDLTLPGDNGSFGEDMMDAFSTGVFDRTVGGQLTPDGKQLEPNRGEYGEEKDDAGKPVGIGLDADSGDRMLSLVQLRGEREVEPDRATMVYGVSDAAKDKANWFTSGSDGSSVYGEYSGASNQPGRPFWDFNPDVEAEIVGMCEARLERAIREQG